MSGLMSGNMFHTVCKYCKQIGAGNLGMMRCTVTPCMLNVGCDHQFTETVVHESNGPVVRSIGATKLQTGAYGTPVNVLPSFWFFGLL